MSDNCIQKALALVEKAGRMDLVNVVALGPLRPARKASQGAASAVIACLLPCLLSKVAQVRKGGRTSGRAMGSGGGVVGGRRFTRIRGAVGKAQRVSST
ncbi:hypothetical protein NDU88_002661 [Pleurodeles waltl]|uniref:Uncharacterized protein n=1 Tax=Pleurodeles waltl TaxID=8319 RepID=A0AAV7M8U2_PLEWA|nr:hypothetical protein NDU88_002661 [Pleurodeles waltl]